MIALPGCGIRKGLDPNSLCSEAKGYCGVCQERQKVRQQIREALEDNQQCIDYNSLYPTTMGFPKKQTQIWVIEVDEVKRVLLGGEQK